MKLMNKTNKALSLHKEKITCSFCLRPANPQNPVILTDLTAKAICVQCVCLAEQAAEIVPTGAVRCLGCQSYDGVSVQYEGSTVKWVFSGLNKEGTVGYRATEVAGSWSLNSIPKKATCIRCFAIIPLANLKLSPYRVPARR